MKTKEEIQLAFEDLGIYADSDEVKVEILPTTTREGKPAFIITVSAMYAAPRFKSDGLLELLKLLQRLTGAKNVDILDTFANSGCETCDWGSSYGKEYLVW